MTREVKTLKEATAPVRFLNCIFCMGIFEIPANRPRFLLSAVYVASMLTGYFFVLYQGIVIFKRKYGYTYFLFYFVLAVNVMVAILAIILFWRKSENLCNITKRCSMVDVTIEALGIKREYHKIFRRNIFLIIFWITGMILLIFMYSIWMYRDIEIIQACYVNMCFCIPIMINSAVDATFVTFIMCIRKKFRSINILLNNVIQCANKSNAFKIPAEQDKTCIATVRARYNNQKDKIIHLIQTLRHLHLETVKIARQINYTYCVQLLLELTVHFTIVTATCYSLYISLSGLSKSFEITNDKIIAMFCWGCIYSSKIIIVNDIVTRVSEEAYKTGEIVQSFDGSSLDNDMREEIQQFTQQIVLQPLNFTAAGFFTINNSLTGKFFATVTTYVVILIQMDTPT